MTNGLVGPISTHCSHESFSFSLFNHWSNISALPEIYRALVRGNKANLFINGMAFDIVTGCVRSPSFPVGSSLRAMPLNSRPSLLVVERKRYHWQTKNAAAGGTMYQAKALHPRASCDHIWRNDNLMSYFNYKDAV